MAPRAPFHFPVLTKKHQPVDPSFLAKKVSSSSDFQKNLKEGHGPEEAEEEAMRRKCSFLGAVKYAKESNHSVDSC